MWRKKQKLTLFFNIKPNRMKNPKIINVIIYDGQPFHINKNESTAIVTIQYIVRKHQVDPITWRKYRKMFLTQEKKNAEERRRTI